MIFFIKKKNKGENMQTGEIGAIFLKLFEARITASKP